MDPDHKAPLSDPKRETVFPLERARMALRVFDAYPYGLLLLLRDGSVIGHNEAARGLFGELAAAADDPGAYIAAEVLSRLDEQVGADLAVIDRALKSDVPLPEVRIDLPAGSAVDAAWITVAGLDSGEHVIMELRPGLAHDRRRRTKPHWARGPELRIYALGRTRVESAEASIAGRWLEHRTGQLLKYLITERHRTVFPDEIVEQLWPDSGARGLQSVRYFIHRLREQLEPERAPRAESSFIRYSEGGYYVDPAHVRIDADEYESAAKAGFSALEAGDWTAARTQLERAVEVYGGDFLADEPYAEWAMAERTRLRALATEALSALATLAEEGGDLDTAAMHLVRLCGLDPFDVDVHRALIGLCLRRGRRTEALRRYDTLRERLMATFGEELDFTLGDLAPATGTHLPQGRRRHGRSEGWRH